MSDETSTVQDDVLEPELEPGEAAEATGDGADQASAEAVEAEVIEINPLEKELADTTARLRTVSAAYRKLQEEFNGFKQRQARQLKIREEIIKGDAVSKLFEPLENLRRTIEALRRVGLDPAQLEGVELVYKNFLDGFHGMGLEEIGVEGEPFNTDVHEALTMMPVQDAAMDGKVVQVFDHGYRVGTRVIKPARVIIGQHVETAGEA
ncbi:MAG: nucleotide exchange factor GrpE [Alphaproteobacteria bacterium]|nr:nucleotide exchange factor GrpE [Alphaproteobacteria bacterium]